MTLNPQKIRLLVLSLLLTAPCIPEVAAQAVSVTASLSQTRARAGEPLQLFVEIGGSRHAEPPQPGAVDGLQIDFTGRSMQMRMENFRTSSSLIFTYNVLPLRAGEFVIPEMDVVVDGRTYTTEPLQLTVDAGSTPSRPDAADQSDLLFAELIVPKTEVYVGEVVPYEIHVYIAEGVAFELEGAPRFIEEGFTSRKVPGSRQQTATRNGRQYNVVVFQSAVTPIKTGELQLGPGEIRASVQVREQRRSSSPFDIFGQDIFNNFNMMRVQEVTIPTDSVLLDVKPLPEKNKPSDFSGAVGKFELAAELPNARTAVGEPLTLRLTLSGRGDFDRASAPAKVGGDEWRSYPPSERFDQDDELGISGRKTWEFSLVPEQPTEKIPVFEFSYFDPVEETYRTLRSDALPVTVTGGPRKSQPSASAAQPAPEDPEDAPTQPEPARDILHILERPSPERPLVVWHRTASFAVFHGIAAAITALVLGGVVVARRRSNRKPAWVERERELFQQIAKSGEDVSAALHAAVRWLDFQSERHGGIPSQVQPKAAQLRQRHDELRYSGGGTAGRMSAAEVREIARAIRAEMEVVK